MKRVTTLRGLAENSVGAKEADWPSRGPQAITEVVDAVLASGEDLLGYQDFWDRARRASTANRTRA
eukprot:2490163-Lingulodinium_polyedra.AAC.1